MGSADDKRADASPLDELVEAVAGSAKYRTVTRELIRRVGAQELEKRRNAKAAIKATKSKLHQVAGAYGGGQTEYDRWLEQLRSFAAGGSVAGGSVAEQRDACAAIMAHHASTQERLPILPDFYATLLSGLSAELLPIRTVADLACGLNPLTWPWLRATGTLAPDVTLHTYDIYTDLADFLNAAFPQLGIRGTAHATDLLQSPPTEPVDLALLFKAIPCLEQLDKDAGRTLLDAIDARVLLVSFPVRSLGGRRKGMAANYRTHFDQLMSGRRWTVHAFEFETELVYRVIREG